MKYRLNRNDDKSFDEIVVSTGKRDGCIVHAEMLNNRDCFVDVAGLLIWVHTDRNGKAEITSMEDSRKGRKLQAP